MKSHGKCHCLAPIIASSYKLKEGHNQFMRVFRCKDSISHTHSETDLEKFDINWHKKQTDLMVC